MKITLFTSNQRRHNFLINLLSKNCKKLFVIQECATIFTGKKIGLYKKNKLIEKYFLKVKAAENKIFKDYYIKRSNKINLLSLQYGDLNYIKIKEIEPFLKSDLYIIFGSSFIKGNLLKYLVKKKAINIHMGISPCYKGSDCNFWALYENNYNLVGSTIHYISKTLDNGPILYHALSEPTENNFDYSMLAVKSAIISIKKNISTGKIFNFKKIHPDNSKIKRYSKSIDFNEKIIKKFYKMKILQKSIIKEDLKDVFILKKKYFFNDQQN